MYQSCLPGEIMSNINVLIVGQNMGIVKAWIKLAEEVEKAGAYIIEFGESAAEINIMTYIEKGNRGSAKAVMARAFAPVAEPHELKRKLRTMVPEEIRRPIKSYDRFIPKTIGRQRRK